MGVAGIPIFEAAALGFVGGAIPDILALTAGRHGPPPAYLRNRFFWASLTMLCLFGSLVSVLTHPLREFDALAIGYTAPSLFSGVAMKKRLVRSVRTRDGMGHKPEIPFSLLDKFRISIIASGELERKPTFIGGLRNWWGAR